MDPTALVASGAANTAPRLLAGRIRRRWARRGRPTTLIHRLTVAPTRRVALTFDDGPHPDTTDAILDVLVNADVPATFFVLGEECEGHPAPLKHAIEAGMAIGVHGWTHAELTGQDDLSIHDGLRRSIELLNSFGVEPEAFRAPYGSTNERVQRVAASLGLRSFIWNVDSRDWTKPGPEVIADTVLAEATDRSIILFHDGGGDRTQTVAALPRVIAGLRDRGYGFALLNE